MGTIAKVKNPFSSLLTRVGGKRISSHSKEQIQERSVPDKGTFLIRQGSLLEANSLEGIVNLQASRAKKYLAMRRLMLNSTIRTTVDMYVDEICNTRGTGSTFKNTAESDLILDSLQAFLARAGFVGNLRAIAIQLIVYGDVYIRTSHYRIPDDVETGNGVKVVKSAEVEPEHFDISTYALLPPDCVFDVRGADGVCKGFIITNTTLDTDTTTLMGNQLQHSIKTGILMEPSAIIHLKYGESYYPPSKLTVSYEDGSTEDLFIDEGDPFLLNAYNDTLALELMEDSLDANRQVKAALVRILQVEVGDIPDHMAEAVLDSLEDAIETKMSYDKNTSQAQSYPDPPSWENIVYTCTKNGKGVINVQNLGGDVNVKDIVDLEYRQDKQLSTLGIPKQFLNYSGAEGLGAASGVLTQTSSRFYHRIINMQHAISLGAEAAAELYFTMNNLEFFIGSFSISLLPPLGPEDTIREASQQAGLDRVSSLFTLCDSLGINDTKARLEVVKSSLDEVSTELYGLLLKYLPVSTEETSEEGGEDDFGGIEL